MNKLTSRLMGLFCLLVILSSPGLIYAISPNALIDTVAGNGQLDLSGDGGPATAAALNGPHGVTVDAQGNIYIADTENNRIRKVMTPTGTITTLAGTGTTGLGEGGFSGDNGLATLARLNAPEGVAVDAAGHVYIADTENHRIRQIISPTGLITTVAGSGTQGFNGDNQPAPNAHLDNPRGVAVDSQGNLYIADTENHRIRKVSAATGLITTVAGNDASGFQGDGGPATAAQLDNPRGVAVDSQGNLYIADQMNHRIRQVISATGLITTVAGSGTTGEGNGGFSGDNGPATSALLNEPFGVTVDGAGNFYIADQHNQRIRQVLVPTNTISSVAGMGPEEFGFSGDGGPAIEAKLNGVYDVAVDPAGNLYIADRFNSRIRKVDAAKLVTDRKVYLPIVLK